jgi:hypothetical protein
MSKSLLKIHENIFEKLLYFHHVRKIPNIIFHGSSGSGKRTIVNDFINVVYENDAEKIKSFVKVQVKSSVGHHQINIL